MTDCVFCMIADGKVPSQKVFEDETVVAFRDLSPKAPQHVLIVPKKHIANVAQFQAEDKDLAAHIFVDVVPKLAKELKLDGGFRLVINTGDDGGQTVNHLHVHLLGGRKMTWPPG